VKAYPVILQKSLALIINKLPSNIENNALASLKLNKSQEFESNDLKILVVDSKWC
jgi:hypothetical protein